MSGPPRPSDLWTSPTLVTLGTPSHLLAVGDGSTSKPPPDGNDPTTEACGAGLPSGVAWSSPAGTSCNLLWRTVPLDWTSDTDAPWLRYMWALGPAGGGAGGAGGVSATTLAAVRLQHAWTGLWLSPGGSLTPAAAAAAVLVPPAGLAAAALAASGGVKSAAALVAPSLADWGRDTVIMLVPATPRDPHGGPLSMQALVSGWQYSVNHPATQPGSGHPPKLAAGPQVLCPGSFAGVPLTGGMASGNSMLLPCQGANPSPIQPCATPVGSGTTTGVASRDFTIPVQATGSTAAPGSGQARYDMTFQLPPASQLLQLVPAGSRLTLDSCTEPPGGGPPGPPGGPPGAGPGTKAHGLANAKAATARLVRTIGIGIGALVGVLLLIALVVGLHRRHATVPPRRGVPRPQLGAGRGWNRTTSGGSGGVPPGGGGGVGTGMATGVPHPPVPVGARWEAPAAFVAP